ncbi:hypothetical protein ACDQ55_09060 [Chitinophaga sp. 30R24]|uniref:hypothetical protein n=1 Tax=Chitinophaga sp. 30R24 TaxID=3248838 RepID=UPI003B9094DC
MYRITSLLIILLFICAGSNAQEAYGLEFACKNIAQEARTSLDVFPDKPLIVKDKYAFSFELAFLPFYNSYFGYVFRLTDEKKQNIDLIYNVQTQSFNIVTGNDFSGISFRINEDSLYHHWNRLQFDINTTTHTLQVSINGQLLRSIHHPVLSGRQLHLCFGASHRKPFKSFDVAPMRIKDVKIYKDNTLQHHWPLDQVRGNIDKDLLTGQIVSISNPIWLRPRFNEWQLADSITMNGNASVAFDPTSETVYITGRDTVYNYNCSARTLLTQTLPRSQGTPAGIRAIYDPVKKQFCNFFPDKQQVAYYDSTAGQWDQPLEHDAVTTYWHANILFSHYDSAVYALGGYGNFHYKNEVLRYHTRQQSWENQKVSGDFFTPRYLSAAGINKAGDSIYILGGYGSLAGDQLLNPHCLYDLTVYDVKRRSFKSIYKLKEPEEPFAFASNMIIPNGKQEYYTLIYANDRMNSSLQLIKGSLKAPEYSKMTSSFPYRFYDTKSAAYLFYCPQNDKLIAVTLFTPKNNITHAKIYTIQFSPYGLAVSTPEKHIPVYVIRLLIAAAVGLSLLLIAAGISFFAKNKNTGEQVATPVLPTADVTATVTPADNLRTENLHEQHLPEINVQEDAPIAINFPVTTQAPTPGPAVYLFGQFTVLDNTGNDITRSFSPLLKELFLLIFLHSLMGKHGISSEKVNELLWPGRSVKDAKNNRSVNLVKLKNLLDKTGAYTLLKENDKWIFHFNDEQVYVDLQAYLALLATASPQDTTTIAQIAGIVHRGAFLQETEYVWLDKFKADIAAQVIPLLTQFLENNQVAPELTIHLCDCILHFDALSEEAVLLKCKALVALRQHASARKVYTSFIAEYERIYGVPFEMDYAQVVDPVNTVSSL